MIHELKIRREFFDYVLNVDYKQIIEKRLGSGCIYR